MPKRDVRNRGRIFVVSAASGSGKTTLCRRLLKKCRNMVFTTPITTRKLRRGERNRRDYTVVCEKQFNKYRRSGELLEWAKVFGNLYGTPKAFVDRMLSAGKDVLLVIDVQGAFKVKKVRPSAILIFILPPSLRELKKRLRERNSDDPKQIKLRLKVARHEIAQAKKYDYVVVNDDLEKAVDKLKEIITIHTRHRQEREVKQ